MLAYVFVLMAVAMRILLAPLAFAPVGAALLYFGARQPRRRMWFALAALVTTDIVLSKAVYGYPLTADLVVTWAWYAGVLLLGATAVGNASSLRLAGAALATSISFFVVSNFATWLVWDMYPKDLGGLAACYLAAIPFFRNQVASDLFFTAVFFSLPAVVAAVRQGLKARPDVAAI